MLSKEVLIYQVVVDDDNDDDDCNHYGDDNNGLVQMHKLFSSKTANCFIGSIYGNSVGKLKYYLYSYMYIQRTCQSQ